MSLSVDTAGTAPRPDSQSFAAWAGQQRIFISSVMSPDMKPLRTRVADLVDSLGAEPVWFEAFGGRDDDAEVAYLSEVESSSVYLGILGRTYGRLDKATRMSATHAEYRRAEEQGVAVSVWVLSDDDVQADQKAFIDEVRTFHTTGSYSNAEDLAEGVRRRLSQMAASALSPWVKLGDTVFRAREILDDGTTVTIHAAIHSRQVLADIEAMRSGDFGSHEPWLTHSGQSWPIRVQTITTRTTTTQSTEVEIVLKRRAEVAGSWMGMTLSVGGKTYNSDQLAERDLRQMLFGEDAPSGVLSLGGRIRDFTSDLPTGAVTIDIYRAMFALLLTEALVQSGRAVRVNKATVSPLGPLGRTVSLAWVGHTDRGRHYPTACMLSGMMPRG
jgi:hypothetical protein